MEYVAYDNWQRSKENLENAQQALEDVANDEGQIYEEFYDAEWNFQQAKNRTEYEELIVIYEQKKATKDAMEEKRRIAQDAVDSLSEDIGNLEEAYNNAKEERENQASYIKDEANIDVEPFNPADGPP